MLLRYSIISFYCHSSKSEVTKGLDKYTDSQNWVQTLASMIREFGHISRLVLNLGYMA